MSFNYNKVFLAGNLTRDPEVRPAGQGTVAKFGLAVNRRWKDRDGNLKDETTFVDVEAWGRTAELVGQYLTKGRGCFVEGRLRLDQWDDKESGQKRSKMLVVADSVQFIDSKGQGGSSAPTGGGDEGGAPLSMPSAGAPAARGASPAAQPPLDDEPPF